MLFPFCVQICQQIQRNLRVLHFDCIRIHAAEHFKFTFFSSFATCKNSFFRFSTKMSEFFSFNRMISFDFYAKSQVNGNRLELIPPIFSIAWSFIIIFCVCEFGERLTQQFDMFDVTLCECTWYLMPIELQRMLVIVMSNARQPIHMSSYGGIQSTRNSFKQVRLNIVIVIFPKNAFC